MLCIDHKTLNQQHTESGKNWEAAQQRLDRDGMITIWYTLK